MRTINHKIALSKPALEAASLLRQRSRLRPTLAIILCSGFQHLISKLKVEVEIPFDKIPGFPRIGVAGHSGRLLIGDLGGATVMLLGGRVHFYEGHPMSQVTYAVRVLAAYGIRNLLLTNAAGGLNRKFRAGDFMVISDHINFMGTNPLRGNTPEGMTAFVDLTQAYDPGLQRALKLAARRAGARVHSGVYLAVSGPSYETPAEIRSFAKLGADAVGMSTVPEAIVARQCGLKVAALSCITNLAAGRTGRPLSHAEVLETGERVKSLAAQMLKQFAERYGQEQQEQVASRARATRNQAR